MAVWMHSPFQNTILDLSLPKASHVTTVKQEQRSPTYYHHGIYAAQYTHPSPPLVPLGATMFETQRSPSFYSPPAAECATCPSERDLKRRISETDEASSTSSTYRSSSPQRKRKDSKLARPFKAYINNPLASAHFPSADTILDEGSSQRYVEFRNRYLEQIKEANGGEITVSNANMRRNVNRNSGSTSGAADSSYLQKRMKNNAAAKKSRDRRRMKEDEMAIRIAFLENENLRLTMELSERNKHFARYNVALQPYQK